MFPIITVDVSGLKPNLKYSLIVDVVPVDKHYYRYNQGHWEVRDDITSDEKFETSYTHPWSPLFGDRWMEGTITFQGLRLNSHLESAKSCNHVSPVTVTVI